MLNVTWKLSSLIIRLNHEPKGGTTPQLPATLVNCKMMAIGTWCGLWSCSRKSEVRGLKARWKVGEALSWGSVEADTSVGLSVTLMT